MNKEISEIVIMNGRTTIMMTGIILMACGRGFGWKLLGFFFLLVILLNL